MLIFALLSILAVGAVFFLGLRLSWSVADIALVAGGAGITLLLLCTVGLFALIVPFMVMIAGLAIAVKMTA